MSFYERLHDLYLTHFEYGSSRASLSMRVYYVRACLCVSSAVAAPSVDDQHTSAAAGSTARSAAVSAAGSAAAAVSVQPRRVGRAGRAVLLGSVELLR